MPDAARAGERVFRGIPVSPGVCRGKILVLGKPQSEAVTRRELSAEAVPDELKRFQQALLDTRRQVQEVQRQIARGLGAQDANIFDAHLLILEDPALIEEVSRMIAQEQVSADYAFHQI